MADERESPETPVAPETLVAREQPAHTPQKPAARAKKNRPLSKAIRTFIVTQLACYETPKVIADLVKKEFDYDINRSTIAYYDPDSATTGDRLSDEWKGLFKTQRDRYLTDVASVPIMNQAYRARQLQRILAIEIDRENTVGARETLEQAAKEDGGAFTNERKVSGSLTIDEILRAADGEDATDARATGAANGGAHGGGEA